MNELSLFTGAGGGVLGSILLGHRIIGYVENNEYCQKVLRQRIDDGILDNAPIFGDIRAFNREGYAESYKGLVDVVSGGFPCQDISLAGKGAGITGERSGLWFEMESTIRIVRPRYVFIENSPALLVRGFERVICGLSEMGFDAAWGIVSASDVGAPHLRKRVWLYASNTKIQGLEIGRNQPRGYKGKNKKAKESRSYRLAGCFNFDGKWKSRNWIVEAGLCRKNERVAYRVERIEAIGNGQVPRVAEAAFRILHQKLG